MDVERFDKARRMFPTSAGPLVLAEQRQKEQKNLPGVLLRADFLRFRTVAIISAFDFDSASDH